jgi:hypothetical protein
VQFINHLESIRSKAKKHDDSIDCVGIINVAAQFINQSIRQEQKKPLTRLSIAKTSGTRETMAWVYLVLAIGLFPHMTVSCHENTSLCLIIEYLIAASVELVGTKLVTKDGLACKLMDFSSNRAAFQQTTLLTDSATD